MSSILKALKKIEGRKVDKGFTAWPYGSDGSESTDRDIYRWRRSRKILGLLIILCGVAIVGKLYVGSRLKPDDTDRQGATSSVATLPQGSAEINAPATRENVSIESLNAPAPEPVPREADPETTLPSSASPSPSESVQTSVPRQLPEPAATEAFGAPPSDNAGLSLVALAWSRQPESRFVVINGQILQEGADIKGSTVVRIEEEYVVMRTDGVTWKLK